MIAPCHCVECRVALARAEGERAGQAALEFVRALDDEQPSDILAHPLVWAADYKHAIGVVARLPELQTADIERGRMAERAKVVAYFRSPERGEDVRPDQWALLIVHGDHHAKG
jgi:hypothetical protein